MKKIKGIFVSYWSDGKIVTPCYLDTKTGELFPETVDVQDMGTLEREKFYVGDSEDGDEYDVCPVCHEYVLKSVMNPGIGHDLNEEQVCSNPDCESREE